MTWRSLIFFFLKQNKQNDDSKPRLLQLTAAEGGQHILSVKAKRCTYSVYPTWRWTQRHEAPHCPVLFALGYSYNICEKCGWQRSPGPFCDEFLNVWPQARRQSNRFSDWSPVTDTSFLYTTKCTAQDFANHISAASCSSTSQWF